jgi:hypothetical protein
MTDALETGMGELTDALITERGSACTYSRGTSSVTFAAFTGRWQMSVGDDGATVVVSDGVDLICRRSELGSFFPPHLGDVAVLGDMTLTVSASNGESHWSDSSGGLVRIHCIKGLT